MMKNISNERVIKITFIISLTVHCLFLSIPGFNSKKFQDKKEKEMFVQIEIKKPSPLPETKIISKKKKEIKKLIKPSPEHKPKKEKVIKQKVKKIEKKFKPIEEEIVKPEIKEEKTENIEEEKPVRQDSDIGLKEEIVKPEIQPKGLSENIKEERPAKEVSYGDEKEINLKEELMLNYQKAVKEKIENCKRYPKWARKQGFEGTVHLKFTILSTGAVKDIKIIKSSGFNILDKEAISTVKRASPFPPIPKKINCSTLTIEVSLVFQLK